MTNDKPVSERVAEANLATATLQAMCYDLAAKLTALDNEQLEALHLAQRGAGELLEGKPSLEPARVMAMFIWGIVGAEQTRRLLAGAAEACELDRVFSLEAETI